MELTEELKIKSDLHKFYFIKSNGALIKVADKSMKDFDDLMGNVGDFVSF